MDGVHENVLMMNDRWSRLLLNMSSYYSEDRLLESECSIYDAEYSNLKATVSSLKVVFC
jgi:hypothetical protein